MRYLFLLAVLVLSFALPAAGQTDQEERTPLPPVDQIWVHERLIVALQRLREEDLIDAADFEIVAPELLMSASSYASECNLNMQPYPVLFPPTDSTYRTLESSTRRDRFLSIDFEPCNSGPTLPKKIANLRTEIPQLWESAQEDGLPISPETLAKLPREAHPLALFGGLTVRPNQGDSNFASQGSVRLENLVEITAEQIQKLLQTRLEQVTSLAEGLGEEGYAELVAMIEALTELEYLRAFATGAIEVSSSNSIQDSGITLTDYRGNRITFPQGSRSFADSVLFTRVGSPVPIELKAPSTVLGLPDWSVPDTQTSNFPDQAFSLGCNGQLAVRFEDNVLIDVSGPDLFVFEIGGNVEPAVIYVSNDGTNWENVGRIGGALSSVDLADSPLKATEYRYVMVEDAGGTCSGITPGADIDAIGAIGAAPTATDGREIKAEIPYDNIMDLIFQSRPTQER